MNESTTEQTTRQVTNHITLFDVLRSVGILLVAILFLALSVYRPLFWEFVDPSESAYYYDSRSGEVTPIDSSGYYSEIPWLKEVYTIYKLPTQVKVEGNNRVLNAMLVQYQPKGLKQFISLHGVGNYDEYRISDILKSYAYSTRCLDEGELERKYTFLHVAGVLAMDNNIPVDSQEETRLIKQPDNEQGDSTSTK